MDITINEQEVSSITIDRKEVFEITVDGLTVWNSLYYFFEGFESGTLDVPTSTSEDGNVSVSSDKSFGGNYSLYISSFSTGGRASAIFSEEIVKKDSKIGFYVYPDSMSGSEAGWGRFSFDFAIHKENKDDLIDGYSVELMQGDSAQSLVLSRTDEGINSRLSTVTPDEIKNDRWYYFSIVWGKNGDIIVNLTDTEVNEVVAEISVNDTTYEQGYSRIRTRSEKFSSAKVYFDNYYAKPL